MLSDPRAMAIIQETANILTEAYEQGIAGAEIPPEMDYYLRNSLFEFSGFKTHQELTEVAALIRTDDGKVKPFNRFALDVQKTHADYNVNYLAAEYQFAVSSSQMAARWADVERDGDDYDVQYRTAGDASVRESHRALHNITLPPSDPFWDKYYPPNGWGCRCTAVQVLRDKYEVSDSDEAMVAGLESTKQISDGIDKGAIFRFNPGKTRQVLPPKHPYYKVPKEEKKTIVKIVEDLYPEIETTQDLTVLFKELDADRKWFARGFEKFEIEKRKKTNGSTNLRGTIWLTQERMDLSISACNKLRKGASIDKNEADAIATLWHETTHNRNKHGNEHLTKLATHYMELANEFVARKTLPEFYKSLGSTIQHPELMENRQSTGYNRWVRNYCKLIEKTNANADNVLKDVQEYLFNEPYSQQASGLVEALQKNGAAKSDGTQLKTLEIKRLVKQCVQYSEKDYEEIAGKLLVEN